MNREKIIISDLDIKILEFIQSERIIKEISAYLEINDSMIKKHMDRLRRLGCFEENKVENFKKVRINKRGKRILLLLKNG